MKNLIIIDDDPSERFLISFALMQYDCKVREAADGAEGLAMIQKETPDIAVVDQMMPKLSGYDLIQKVRTLPGLERLPFIMITAKHFDKEFPELLKLQNCEFLAKPFHKEMLITAIEKIIGPLPPKPFKL